MHYSGFSVHPFSLQPFFYSLPKIVPALPDVWKRYVLILGQRRSRRCLALNATNFTCQRVPSKKIQAAPDAVFGPTREFVSVLQSSVNSGIKHLLD